MRRHSEGGNSFSRCLSICWSAVFDDCRNLTAYLPQELVFYRTLGHVMDNGKAATDLRAPQNVAFGLGSHQPDQHWKGRVQDAVLQANNAAAPQKFAGILFEQMQGTPDWKNLIINFLNGRQSFRC